MIFFSRVGGNAKEKKKVEEIVNEQTYTFTDLRKIAKDQDEIQAKLDQIQVELKRIEATQETEGARLAFKAQSEQANRDHQQEQLGFNTGINMSKPQPQNPNVGKGDK